MQIDFSDLQPKRKPTRKERALYRRWVRYLSDSNLDSKSIHSRAASYTEQGTKVPNE